MKANSSLRFGFALLLLLVSQNALGAPCVGGYTDSFLNLNNLASERRLKAETAAAEVASAFGQRPQSCEPGAYGYFLDQLMLFAKRALRSGATPQTPKEGWVRAAAFACGYAPRTVPSSEYAEARSKYEAALSELTSLVQEAGGGVAEALLAAFPAATPVPETPAAAAATLAKGPTYEVIVPAEIPKNEPPPSEPAEQSGMVEPYLKRAAEYYNKGLYDQSANEMQKAYLIKPKPLYLFNIAQSYRRGGRPKEALRLYRQFLQKEPETPLLAETRGYIYDMEKVIAEQARAEQAQQDLARQKSLAEGVQADLAVAKRRAEAAERERKKPPYKRAWFWGVLASSAAAVAAGVTLTVIFTGEPKTDGGIVSLTF